MSRTAGAVGCLLTRRRSRRSGGRLRLRLRLRLRVLGSALFGAVA